MYNHYKVQMKGKRRAETDGSIIYPERHQIEHWKLFYSIIHKDDGFLDSV